MKLIRKIQRDVEKLFGYHTNKHIDNYITSLRETSFSGHREGEAEVDIRPVVCGLRDAPLLRVSNELERETELGELSPKNLLILVEETTHWCDQLDRCSKFGPSYSVEERIGEEFLANFSRRIIGDEYGVKDFFIKEGIKDSDKIYQKSDDLYKKTKEAIMSLPEETILSVLRALAHKHGKERLVYAKELIDTYSKN